MTNGKFMAVCKNCGKKGNVVSGTFQGSMPGNMPHNPEWVKI